jgi:hypothetical protein
MGFVFFSILNCKATRRDSCGSRGAILDGFSISSPSGVYSIFKSGFAKTVTIPLFVISYTSSRWSSYTKSIENMEIHDNAVQANR